MVLIRDIRVDWLRALLYTSAFTDLLPVLLAEKRAPGLTTAIIQDCIPVFLSVCNHASERQ
jgi:hypothetical protein